MKRPRDRSSASMSLTLLAVLLPQGCGPVEGTIVEQESSAHANQAIHAWAGYHWASASAPVGVLALDSVTAGWNPFFAQAIDDWSVSTVLDVATAAGDESATSRRKCTPTLSKIRVCNASYGRTKWLGLAQVWVNDSDHILKATAKMNDSYFTLPAYNTPAWKSLVMCQEVGHTVGLDHQDENNTNANLGTCMDYSNNPAGPPSNEHPNEHDYEQLELIYGHLDASAASASGPDAAEQEVIEDRGDLVAHSARTEHWVRALRDGGALHTFVVLAE